MREIGLSNVAVNETPNAVGVIPGRSGRALVFVSTLDDLATVAENQRAASGPPRVEDDRVVGLVFRRTKIENGRVVPTDETFERRGTWVISSIKSKDSSLMSLLLYSN